MHKFESNNRFVAASRASAWHFFHRSGAPHDGHAAFSRSCMPALRCGRSALECRPCSRPAFRHSRTQASERKAPPALPPCARSLSAAASTVSWFQGRIASRTNTCPPVMNGWPGSPASPARPASPSCSRTARRSSSTAATPCRRKRRSTKPCSPSSIWWRRRPRNGWSATPRAAARSATTPGCTRPRAPTASRRPAREPAPNWCR